MKLLMEVIVQDYQQNEYSSCVRKLIYLTVIVIEIYYSISAVSPDMEAQKVFTGKQYVELS